MSTLTLKAFDIPTIHRYSVGLDEMFDTLLRSVNANTTSNYPPYNIIRHDENRYAVELAVAGFKEDEIDVTVEEGYLTVEGHQKVDLAKDPPATYLHHGISKRDFRKTWPLGNHVEVTTATFADGILTVNLERIIPEEMKPKKIAINSKKR
ncbi:MAG: heat-shock protein [Actinobacteria bacterium]|nr:heat-shock protein [Actinomycetota bacterium]